MKKIIISIIISAAALCGHAQAPADSLSVLLGQSQGAMLQKQLQRIAMSGSFKQQLADGLSTVLLTDTTNLGFIEGLQMGLQMLRDLTSFSRMGAPIDRAAFVRSLNEALMGTPFDDNEVRALTRRASAMLEPYRRIAEENQKKQEAAQALHHDSIAMANSLAGKVFIDSLVKADKDVRRLSSGLAYKVIEKGKGKTPRDDQSVDVRYTGRLINGKMFDTSGDETRTFPRAGVIKGFSEGLGLMNKGSKYLLYIPGPLAYGDAGAGNLIGPNETLIFEVELVDFH